MALEDALKTLIDAIKRDGRIPVDVGEEGFRAVWAGCQDPFALFRVYALTGDRLRLVQAACAIARLVMIYVPAGELRPLMALETAEAWVFGAAPIEAVRSAAEEAWRAAGRRDFDDHGTKVMAPAPTAASFAAQSAFNRDADLGAVLETLHVLRRTGGLSDEAARVLLSAVARAFLPCPPLESLVPSGPSL